MKPVIPKGWRRLRKGIVARGDKWLYEGKWNYTGLVGLPVGAGTYIRRKAKTK